jgi:hypothetical protein
MCCDCAGPIRKHAMALIWITLCNSTVLIWDLRQCRFDLLWKTLLLTCSICFGIWNYNSGLMFYKMGRADPGQFRTKIGEIWKRARWLLGCNSFTQTGMALHCDDKIWIVVGHRTLFLFYLLADQLFCNSFTQTGIALHCDKIWIVFGHRALFLFYLLADQLFCWNWVLKCLRLSRLSRAWVGRLHCLSVPSRGGFPLFFWRISYCLGFRKNLVPYWF